MIEIKQDIKLVSGGFRHRRALHFMQENYNCSGILLSDGAPLSMEGLDRYLVDDLYRFCADNHKYYIKIDNDRNVVLICSDSDSCFGVSID